MGRHNSIIKLGIDLGYFKNESGVCNGVTSAWIEACFCNEEVEFNKRVDMINGLTDTGSFIEQISAIKEKVKQRISLSVEEKESLDVLAFFEKVSLYQNPCQHKALYDESLGQFDRNKISKIISSDKIQENGGMAQLSSSNGIYSVEELKNYLSDIAGAVEKSNPLSNKEVAVLINTPNHAMAIVYEKYQNNGVTIPCWRFMDINRKESSLIRIENIEDVIEFIRANYYDEKDKYITLSTGIVTTENNPNKDYLISNINLIQLPSSITPEKLESKGIGGLDNKFQLAKQALITGNIEILSKLNPDVINEMLEIIDYVHPGSLIHLIEQGYNPIRVMTYAAVQGYPSVIDACAANSIDLDIPFRPCSPEPPLFMAALNGNVNVIRALHNHGIQLDKTSPNGDNLAHYAAMNGHDNVLAWLARYQTNLFNQRNKKGETPAEIATHEGYDAALREIIKSSVISLDDYNNLLFTAASEGHAHLIPLFVSKGVDLSQLNLHGYGAAHLAAYKGNVKFLSELGNQGVDLCLESKDGKTPLMLAQEQPLMYSNKLKSPETIAAIKVIIETQVNQKQAEKCKSITIYFREEVEGSPLKQDLECPPLKTGPSSHS